MPAPDFPIDPALAHDDHTPIDPILAEPEQIHQDLTQHPPHEPQYSPGPQGDPFSPVVPIPYYALPHGEPVAAPSKQPMRRKRRVRREDKCSICKGTDTRNDLGVPEPMISCHECGRSGHPSCFGLAKQADVMRSYAWICFECKNCEVCHEKGDDARILFCDWCDRGWHLDCMVPPLDNPPAGAWHCPVCPPLIDGATAAPDSDSAFMHPYPADQPSEDPLTEQGPHTTPSEREASVASTSRSAADSLMSNPPRAPPRRPANKRRASTKRASTQKRVVVSEPSESEDVQDVSEPVVLPKRRGRPPKALQLLRLQQQQQQEAEASNEEEGEEGEEAPVVATPRSHKRKRRASSPATPVPRVRLRLPLSRGSKTKGGKVGEEEEAPKGMFDDVLTPEQRDTSKTAILNIDKVYFNRSRQAAENKIAASQPSTSATSSRPPETEVGTPLRARPLRSATLQHLAPTTPIDSQSPGPSTPGGSGAQPKFEPGVLRIRYIRFGEYDIKTWYDAPFPEEYATIPDGRLWICEFCLKYMKSRFGAARHRTKCKARHPPGDEIYRDGSVSIFEVDGRRNKIYCQNLCLLSKMFLDHKSLFYDVEPFLFYVITEVDDVGARFVGYFSKEKRCPKDYNLSCIMTLPVRQRQGWGNLLIDFSYLLSKIEQRVGSPEKPLSGLGAIGYKNYWTLAVMRFLARAPENVRLEDISSATSMTMEDVCATLTQQKMLHIREPSPHSIRPLPGQTIKYRKGRRNGGSSYRQPPRLHHSGSAHNTRNGGRGAGASSGGGGGDREKEKERDKDGGDTKGPFVPPQHYEIHFEREQAEEYVRRWEAKGYLRLRPEKLQWTPYVVQAQEQMQQQQMVVPNGLNGTATTTVQTMVPVPSTLPLPLPTDARVVVPLPAMVKVEEWMSECGDEDAEGSVDEECT